MNNSDHKIPRFETAGKIFGRVAILAAAAVGVATKEYASKVWEVEKKLWPDHKYAATAWVAGATAVAAVTLGGFYIAGREAVNNINDHLGAPESVPASPALEYSQPSQRPHATLVVGGISADDT